MGLHNAQTESLQIKNFFEKYKLKNQKRLCGSSINILHQNMIYSIIDDNGLNLQLAGFTPGELMFLDPSLLPKIDMTLPNKPPYFSLAPPLMTEIGASFAKGGDEEMAKEILKKIAEITGTLIGAGTATPFFGIITGPTFKKDTIEPTTKFFIFKDDYIKYSEPFDIATLKENYLTNLDEAFVNILALNDEKFKELWEETPVIPKTPNDPDIVYSDFWISFIELEEIIL